VVPIKDENGNVFSDRIDNLIHASATVDEAEREIKLWFKPSDIPPRKRAYPVETSDTFYYYGDGKLLETYEPGVVCLLAPGDVAWSSDLDILRQISSGATPDSPLVAVAEKYLINKRQNI
jgi:nucleoside-diphosphate kinase